MALPDDSQTLNVPATSSPTPSPQAGPLEPLAPPLLRDRLSPLPPEIGLSILGFIDSPCTLLSVGAVSRRWCAMVRSEELWRGMCVRWGFGIGPMRRKMGKEKDEEPLEEMEEFAELPMDAALEWIVQRRRKARRLQLQAANDSLKEIEFSYRVHFKNSYIKLQDWLKGGRLLRTHRLPMLSSPPLGLPSSTPSTSHPPLPDQFQFQPPTPTPPPLQPDSGVVTCLALDASWIVVGLASSRIHVFSARTGVLARTLVGHESGVWGVCLVSAGGRWEEGQRKRKGKRRERGEGDDAWRSLPPALKTAVGLDDDDDHDEDEDSDPQAQAEEHYPPARQSSPCFSSAGWGQPNALVVSGGCDRVVRVWDVKSGHLIHALCGHTSTIRCMRTLHSRPLALTGSRDGTLRTWDVRRGRALRVLEGHRGSVRCIDVNGRRAASGSYDTTCRVWDLDTGACLRVLRGHLHQVYSVAFDGARVVTGGLDTTVRVWDAQSGCEALIQAHTALVCQLQLSRRHRLLVTGASDGRVIAFSLGAPSPESASTTHDTEPEPAPYTALYRLPAHTSSITSLQLDARLLVTSGTDGRVRVWETRTGRFVRSLCRTGEGEDRGEDEDGGEGGEGREGEGPVWKVGFVGYAGEAEEGEAEEMGDVCVVAGRRGGKTVLDVWGFGGGEPS